jgi:hypothetical protein
MANESGFLAQERMQSNELLKGLDIEIQELQNLF